MFDDIALLQGVSDDAGREFVWGLFARGLGLVYFICHVAFIPQIVPNAGKRGLSPVAPLLDRLRHDMPLLTRLWYFPTILWVCSADWFIQLLPIVGALSGLLAVVGGPWSPLFLGLAWYMCISIDTAVEFVYPWDSVILESGFLAMWLPATKSLLDVLGGVPAVVASDGLRAGGAEALRQLSDPAAWAMVGLPLPILAFTLRWLTCRLLVGFGKLKFLETTTKDALYIKYFFVGMPIPSKWGFFGHKMPAWFHRLSLFIMFVIEIPLPFFVFFNGWPRVLAAWGIIALQIGIQLSGNFGYFNILTVMLCLPCFDAVASVWDARVPLLGATPLAAFPASELALWFFLAIILPGSVLLFPLNSWCTLGGMYWPNFLKSQPQWLVQPLFALYRFVQPWRIVHAYGVFPPNSSPGIRWAPVYEGSMDGVSWKPYRYKYYVSGPRCAPCHVAPWHPRLDHAIFYESLGMNGHNFIANSGNAHPYRFSRTTPWVRLQARLLEGPDSPVNSLFAVNPFPDHAPRWVRVSLFGFTPASMSHILKTGEWWHPTRVATHLPPLSLGPKVDAIWDQWLPEPERFYWEARTWRERAGRSAGTLEADEYEEAWEFIAFLRAAATQAAAVETDADADADANAATIAAGATDAAATSAVDTPKRSRARRGSGAASAPSAGRSTARRGASTTDPVTPVEDSMTAEEALRVFHWKTLPHVFLAVRRKYELRELLAIERTIGRMLLPALARLTRLYHRATPTDADLAAEVAEDAGVVAREGLSAADRAALEEWSSAEAVAAAASAAETRPWGAKSVEKWEDAYTQIHAWIDAPMDDKSPVPGASQTGYTKSLFRVGLYAQWWMLVGGRTRFERLIGDPKTLFGKRVPTEDRSGETLPSIFRRSCAPALSPRDMSIPGGLFLASVLHYETIAQHAIKFRLMRATSRPESFEKPMSEAAIPGFLSLIPSLSRESQLRLWNDLENRWCEPMRVPLFDALENGDWVMRPTLEIWPGREVLRSEAPAEETGYGPEDLPVEAWDGERKSQ